VKVFALFGRPSFLMKFHTVAAWLWLGLGVIGTAEYLVSGKSAVLANSIPALFFISVYANTVGHWSSQQASKVEEKQDDQMDDVEDDVDDLRG